MTNPVTRVVGPHPHRRVRGINQGYTAPGCDPTLPATVDTTYNLPLGTTFNPADSAAFQTALNNSVGGDVIVLAAGTVYSGPFTLPVKAGSSWIYIISSALASLPAAGTRVGPSNVGNMPTLRMSAAGSSIFDTTGAVHHYRFVGIHGDVLNTITDTFGRAAIVIGGDAASTSTQAHDFVFDRCYMHGNTNLSMTRFLQWGGARMSVVDSYLSEIHAIGADSQTILSFNGSGPYKYDNCHLEAAGENVMFGGADPADVTMIPSDITLTHNYFFKPLGWIGSSWSIKNLLELKLGIRVLVEGNVFANCWNQAQVGFAVVAWSVNQGGNAPWAETRDVWIRKNKITNACHAFQLTDAGGEVDPTHPGVPMTKVRIEHNVADKLTDVGGQGETQRKAFQIAHVDCLQLLHNTMGPQSTLTHELHLLKPASPSQNYTDRNNIYGIATYGITGDTDGTGAAAYSTFCPSGNIHRNVFGDDAGGQSHQADCYYAANEAGIGFVNEAAGDYHLSGGSAYKGLGDDGLDPGADIDAVNAATAGVVD